MDTLIAIIVTHNRLQKLQVSVQATLAQPCTALIVINNDSTDGTRAWLDTMAADDARLHPVHLEKNMGGAGGFECGLRKAVTEFEADWLVCFDDDAFPDADAFTHFLTSDLSGIDAAAASVYQADGDICEMNRPAINPFWNHRQFLKTVMGGGRKGFHITDQHYRGDQAVAIDTTSFVGFFIRADLVRHIGFPHKELFIYGDDVLYTLQVRKSGRRIVFLPWVRFVHNCDTFADGKGTIRPFWKIYYTYRNGLRVYHAVAGISFWLFFPLKLMQWVWNVRRYKNKKGYFKLLRLAIRDYLRGDYSRSHAEILEIAGSPSA